MTVILFSATRFQRKANLLTPHSVGPSLVVFRFQWVGIPLQGQFRQSNQAQPISI